MKAIEAFTVNIERAENLIVLYKANIEEGKEHSNIDDLLRASLVLGVGALDAYVHDRIGERIVRYIKYSIERGNYDDISSVIKILDHTELHEILRWLTLQRPFVQVRNKIDDYIGNQSYQHPGKIENAFELIGKKDIWFTVGSDLDISKRDLKKRLVDIAERRNKIVHEGDQEKSRQKKHQKREIQQEFVQESIDLIRLVVFSLNRL